MNLTDIIILLFVGSLLGLIIYFKIIKKRGNIGCNCSLKSSCNLKIHSIDSIFEDIKNDVKNK
ncbi:MAG: hypothetical protein RBQ91_02030 [Acholeplasma sp.]|nr:hypothetical protein [Acholeplasma sp.]